MPEDPLSSAKAKVSRAHEHFDVLLTDISNRSKPDIRITDKYAERDGVRTGEVVDVLDVAPRDPTPWALMIGDIVTNLRSSLDHVAWALAQRQCRDTRTVLTPAQERTITFPLREQSASISGLILPAAHQTIEGFQPYNRTKRPELELLGVLDELARFDKHRVIVVPERLLILDVNAGDRRVFRQKLDERYHDWVISRRPETFKPDGSFDIVMYPTIRSGRHLSAFELGDIHDLIRDDVIPAFAGFF